MDTNAIYNNLLSNAIFLLVLMVLGGGWLWWKRWSLLRLFKVSRERGLTIYISRLEVIAGGTVGFDGHPRSFQGPTVTALESATAAVIGNLFDYLVPGLESQPGLLKTLLIRDIGVTIEPSPLNPAQIPVDRTIIAVGSPGYNSVSAWIEQDLNPLIRFGHDNSSLIPTGQQPVTDPTQGMVQVLWDANQQRRVFYLAGMSEAGTVAAILYTGRKWEELRRNLGSRQTYACLVRLQAGEPVLLTTIHPN